MALPPKLPIEKSVLPLKKVALPLSFTETIGLC